MIEDILVMQDPSGYTNLPLTGESQLFAVTVSHKGAEYQCGLTFTERTAYSLFLHTAQPGETVCKLVSTWLWNFISYFISKDCTSIYIIIPNNT